MEKAFVIRTCNADMTAHGGFVWPESGEVVCPDWNPKPECGNGLHGLLDGQGDYGLLSSDANAKWLIVEVDRAECVDIDSKVKFPRGNVVYCGGMAGAMTRISAEWVRIALASNGGAITHDDESHAATTGEGANAATTGEGANAATTGHRANAATTGRRANAATTGRRANAATTGYRANAATTGDWANAATTGDEANAATTGDWANAATTGHRANAATTGYRANASATGKNAVAACLGTNGEATAGENGVLVLAWWDEKAERPRISVAYVGENGIKPNVAYRLNERGEFIEA